MECFKFRYLEMENPYGCLLIKWLFCLTRMKLINIRKHINNIFRSSEVDRDNNTQKMRVDGVKQSVAFYSLDVILAVGYRVNSKRGIAFRKWANNVLKQFILKGYAINEKRLQALEKTVDIQTRMLADALDIEEKDVMVKLVMNLLEL